MLFEAFSYFCKHKVFGLKYKNQAMGNSYSIRWNPKVVNIGGIPLGGDLPIRIQSMTNTNTLETASTVAQCIRLIEAGCDYVRIAVPGLREAAQIEEIKKTLRKAGYSTPLIADIHYNPAAAEVAACIVEKVRINPGNYVDKRKLSGRPLSNEDYRLELEQVARRLQPLLAICKEHKTVIRIGTNHGSLSQRIVQRYGDTPIGMVESAMEFVRICHDFGFHNLVLSMKSSNVRVMVPATRLLVQKMMQENLQYPLHLGVTEAGNGMEGRIKSAVGIGTLLADGIGDTIRVSLTEAPENEIPVARQIASVFSKETISVLHYAGQKNEPGQGLPVEYIRRIANRAGSIGGGLVPVVLLENNGISSVDENFQREGNEGNWFTWHQHISDESGEKVRYCLIDTTSDLPTKDFLQNIAQVNNLVLVFKSGTPESLFKIRQTIFLLDALGLLLPVAIIFESKESDPEVFAVAAALHCGPLLLDGLCDGILLKNKNIDNEQVIQIAFGILQATRSRITKNEYIACPGCGRTKYDLEAALEKVKQATGHLKGLKIAVMGCVVNGPGEMADADYGYVGQGRGKVALYKGKTLIHKNIPESEAIDMLIRLLQEQGHGQDQLPSGLFRQ